MSHVPACPTADQVRAIRIGALELLLAIEQNEIETDPSFIATLHRLAENPVRIERRWTNRLRINLGPLPEAAR